MHYFFLPGIKRYDHPCPSSRTVSKFVKITKSDVIYSNIISIRNMLMLNFHKLNTFIYSLAAFPVDYGSLSFLLNPAITNKNALILLLISQISVKSTLRCCISVLRYQVRHSCPSSMLFADQNNQYSAAVNACLRTFSVAPEPRLRSIIRFFIERSS